MKKTSPRILISLVFVSTLALPISSMAGIKCWTNKQGVRECGNVVPPEYSQEETRTIDDHGITTGVSKRAPTKKELAEQKRKQEEEQKRLEAEKRQQKLEEQQRKKQEANDRVLLATFLTEDDITRSRDRKVSAIDASIELTHITLDKLQEKLDGTKKQAAGFERRGKPIPKGTQQDIDSLQKQIDDKNNYIASQEREKKKLLDKYAADLKRFRELKAEGRQLE